jgi:hypothetical protein
MNWWNKGKQIDFLVKFSFDKSWIEIKVRILTIRLIIDHFIIVIFSQISSAVS